MNETPSRILVVDDEPSITEFVGYALKKEGFQPDVVDNGEDALAMAQENDYDLFVLDIMLPGMDGYELCRRLRTKTSAPTATGPAGDIDLTPREFELMACLMKNAGKVVSREELLRDAWGWEYLTETKTVDTHIKRLRDKIEQAGYDPGLVETVRGYGYRFKL